MTSHVIHFPYMSETIVHNKEDMSMIGRYEKEDYKKGIKYCVIRDNLSVRSDPYHKYNYYCYLTNKEAYHKRYGYLPFPPHVPFSNDAHYMKSCINLWGDIFYDNQQKIIKMNLEEFYKFLEKKNETPAINHITSVFRKEYLHHYKKRWSKLEGLSLVEVGKMDDFIYKGLVLFDILPEFFIKIY